MKQIIGALMFIAGIALGLYVGGYQCFIKGLIQIISEIKSTAPLNVEILVWGIAKVVFAAAAGWLSGFILIVPGLVLIRD